MTLFLCAMKSLITIDKYQKTDQVFFYFLGLDGINNKEKTVETLLKCQEKKVIGLWKYVKVIQFKKQ